MQIMKTLPARILAAVLLLQAVAYYAVASRSERIPAASPLADFPRSIAGWTVEREFPLEKEVQDVLRADDTLNRFYVNPSRNAAADLFIAFFKTQRYGQTPHSPKNCLPGAGWQPVEDRVIALDVPGRPEPLQINQYIITHGDQQSVVLYWYQSHGRVIAREMEAKFWLVADAVRYHRSDTALVRVIVPVVNDNRGAARQSAMEFARTVFPAIVQQLPR
jgi:EpsI family protein